MSIEIDFEMDVDFVPSTNARCKVCNDGLEGWEMAHGILAAATCGTFVYLAGFDLLVPELREKEGRWWKLGTAMAGFILIVSVAHGHAH